METKKISEAFDRMLSFAKEEIKNLINDIEVMVDKSKPVMERVNNLSDVFRESGITLEKFNEKYKDYEEDTKAYELMKLIAKVLNEGHVFKMDGIEHRYYPYFNVSSGFGFTLRITLLRLRIRLPPLAFALKVLN